MGVGAALIMPATLSILTNVFPPHERAKAIAIWAGFAGAGGALGPLIGGFLLDHFWWGSVFLINVDRRRSPWSPGRLVVPTSKDPDRSPLDPLGAALSMVGLRRAALRRHRGARAGLDRPAGLAAFVVAARPARRLRPVGADEPGARCSTSPCSGVRRFATGTLTITLAFFSMFGMFFVATQYLQYVRGYSPLEAGAADDAQRPGDDRLARPAAPRIVERFGARATVAGGLLLHATGFLLLSFSTQDSPYLLSGAALLVIGTGSGLAMAPTTSMIMAAVPMSRAGMGSAVNDTAREVGGAAGIAVLGSILATRYRSGMTDVLDRLPGPVAEMVHRGVGQAIQVAESTGGAQGAALGDAARAAFIDAMALTLRVGSLTALVCAGAVLFLMRAGATDEVRAEARSQTPPTPTPVD